MNKKSKNKLITGIGVGVIGTMFYPTLTIIGSVVWGSYEFYKWGKKTGKIKI